MQFVRNAEAGAEFDSRGQGSQVALPLADHVPAGHSWHVSTPVAPTAAEYSPPAHAEHTYRSRLSWEPAEHSMQESCVSACLYPAAQKQNSTALLPLAELECSGHAAHACASVLPLAVP